VEERRGDSTQRALRREHQEHSQEWLCHEEWLFALALAEGFVEEDGGCGGGV
jgi:hypothetical protein